ncbi:MAG: SulA-like leucine-rich domain-containing protein [Oleibacter sp.]|nr:SulA-like leucine-rich domain-containing protein [Thalassolituus sp.]
MRQLTFEAMPNNLPLSSGSPLGLMRPKEQAPSALRGSLTEVIVGESGALQPLQLLPALAQCSAKKRWLMWLSPSQMMSKQWLISAGLKDSPVLHVAINESTQVTLACRAIASANSHLIIEWLGDLSRETRQKMRDLASNNGTHVILVRGE